MMRTVGIGCVVVVLLCELALSGCSFSAAQSEAQTIVSAANIVISAAGNYKDWGADLGALLSVLQTAGVDVPQQDAQLAQYLIAVAESIKALEQGEALPAGAPRVTGKHAAAPRDKDAVQKWVKVAMTPGADGRTLMDILGKHAEGRDVRACLHVDEQR